MIKFLKNMICKHTSLKFIRNVGGDEQMHHYVKGGGLARSEHVCLDCGCYVFKNERYGE